MGPKDYFLFFSTKYCYFYGLDSLYWCIQNLKKLFDLSGIVPILADSYKSYKTHKLFIYSLGMGAFPPLILRLITQAYHYQSSITRIWICELRVNRLSFFIHNIDREINGLN